MLPKEPVRRPQLGFIYAPPFRIQGVSIAGEATAIQIPELDLGFDMTITLFDYSMFRCNSRCNAFLYGPKWAHVWQVNTTSLGEATDALLKCTFNFWSPLHTVIKWNIIDP